MTQHTFEVFQWSGTGYNSTYTTSHTATIEDDDGSFEGSGDGSETISIDGGSATASISQPYAIDVSFTDTGGTPHVETFYFMNDGSSWYFAPGPDSEFTVGAEFGMYQSHTTGWDYDEVACFVSGTLIETINGPMAVETLEPGTLVKLETGGYSQLRLCLSRRITARELVANPRFKPVRISAGALGAGLPKRNLRVSRQHRMLVRSKIAHRMFGGDVLIPAIKLTALPGIFIEQGTYSVTYFHLLFARHEVVIAEGAPSESFFVTPRSLALMTPKARQEIECLLPELSLEFSGLRAKASVGSARPIPSLLQQKSLVARHQKNSKPLLIH